MEVNKNQAKYQAEANNRGHWWIQVNKNQAEVNKNQAEVNWQYPMVHR